MSTIRFGAACDGPGLLGAGCPSHFNDYDTGDIISCSDCGDDFCPACVLLTHHAITRGLDDICCGDCQGPALACSDDDYVDDPTRGWKAGV